MRFGCHLSIRGGYAAAARAAAALGTKAFQYFPKNPRSLAIKTFDRQDARRCAELCMESGTVSVAHTPYPTNLAANDERQRERTVLSLLNDLDIADSCGSVGIVVHFGIYKGADPLQGYRNIIECIDRVTSRWTGRAKLLLENQAGDHAFMGTTFEELARIRELCRNPEQIGYCLDSCHLFASGMWNGEPDGEWAEKADKLGIWRLIEAVHMNDSAYPGGSRRDRHAPLGKGHIGEAGLRWLFTLPVLRGVPFILETPPDADGTHRSQLALLAQWGGER